MWFIYILATARGRGIFGHPIRKAGLQASQNHNFIDISVTFSGYHPDIMEFCLLPNTWVVMPYFVYDHTLDEKGYFHNIYVRESKNVPCLTVFKNTLYTINQNVLVWL